MMNENGKYFNFPIPLLKGFMIDSGGCLHKILYYAVYSYSTTLEYGRKLDRYQASAEFLNVEFSSGYDNVDKIGKELYEKYSKAPMTGINSSVYWDFRDGNKSEFDKICLLGFLAFKSILGNKLYCRVTNVYWFSRMDGNSKTVDENTLSDEVKKYKTRRYTTKIKDGLSNDWGLSEYGYYTKGFFVSFKLDIDKLAIEVEKRKRKSKENLIQKAKKEARLKALNQLKNEL